MTAPDGDSFTTIVSLLYDEVRVEDLLFAAFPGERFCISKAASNLAGRCEIMTQHLEPKHCLDDSHFETIFPIIKRASKDCLASNWTWPSLLADAEASSAWAPPGMEVLVI